MHELSVCQALIDQVVELAREHRANRVERIVLSVGPLSGVEPALLMTAYPIAAAGTVAEDAALELIQSAVRVRCRSCGDEAEVPANRLSCPACGDYRTELVSGDELLLIRVELTAEAPAPA
jgi:hydrogenase nickel incorporation protein HypA/HybF